MINKPNSNILPRKFCKWRNNKNPFGRDIIKDDDIVDYPQNITTIPLRIINRRKDITPHDCRTYLEYRLIYELFCQRNIDKQLLLQVPLKDLISIKECENFVFDWDGLLQEHIHIDKCRDIILFQFPQPQEAGEAIYGAVVMNSEDNTNKYYLLEYSQDNEWAWGEYLYELGKRIGCIVNGDFNFIHNGFLKEPLLEVFVAKVIHDNTLAKRLVEHLPDYWNK